MKEAFVDLVAVSDGIAQLYLAKGRSEGSWADTRMLILDAKAAVIGHHDVKARIVAVDAAPGFSLFALSQDGAVSTATRRGIEFDFIEGPGTGAGKFGYAKAIRCVDNTLYVCGDMRQIYRKLAGGVWSRFDIGVRMENPRAIGCSLNHLAGHSAEFLFAVGDRGAIYRLSGESWTACPSPTNVSLERALVSAQGELWACGAGGTVLRGDGRRWEVFELDVSDTLWGIAEFGGAIFVCSSQGLYRHSRGEWELVPIADLRGAPYRLTSNAESLWLLGFNDVMRFDGQSWTRVECS